MEKRSGFTLIEILTVIAVIAILVAILIPTLGRVRERAMVTTSFSNLRQIYAASQMYANENRGRVPYALTTRGARNTWYQAISPYMQGKKARADGGDVGASYIANDALICPKWTSSPRYREDRYWVTGYGMNYFLMLPDENFRNIDEPSNSGERNWQGDMFFGRIPFPGSTIFVGNSVDFHIGTNGVAELDRWDGESHVLFADGRVDSITPEHFERLWTDPSNR